MSKKIDLDDKKKLASIGAKAPYRHKIKTVEQIREILGAPPRERKVVMCHGAFDIVHPGHLRHLVYAKEHADILVASITCDDFITKANFRPYVPEELRALNLAALEVVDHVIIDRQPTPLANLAVLQPDFFAKGYEYTQNGNIHPRTIEEIKVLETYGGEMLFTPGDLVFSSSALIESVPPNIAVETLLTLMESESINFEDLRSALEKMAEIRVHVVGDTIVDTLTATNLIGGLTKTPTFSVQVQQRTDFVGGAAIVAKHLRAAGARVSFTTVLGEDAYRDYVVRDLTEAGIAVRATIEKSRPTTNKNAIVAGGYRLLKIDTVDNRPISARTQAEFVESIRGTEADIVMFSDFRHGIFNRDTIPSLIAAIPENVYKVADSQVASRWGNILEFRNFDLITPNEREARFALGDQDSVIRPLASRLYDQSGCKTLILKLSERGVLVQRAPLGDGAKYFFVVGSFVDRVVDPVGAGDALLAYAALARKATGSDLVASILGSFAAAVECECDGNIPVKPDDVRRKIDVVERKSKLV
ncbi:MAG: adenylyltransferase/cytidyltransferase family protein [Telmatospirillum sp.]|nr:adenylyltransferase/cytidyltransferase family protein [Telmatospirillum sp.]